MFLSFIFFFVFIFPFGDTFVLVFCFFVLISIFCLLLWKEVVGWIMV